MKSCRHAADVHTKSDKLLQLTVYVVMLKLLTSRTIKGIIQYFY